MEKKKQRERKTTRDRISASLFECTKRKIKADFRINEKNICCQTFEILFPKTRKRESGGEPKKMCRGRWKWKKLEKEEQEEAEQHQQNVWHEMQHAEIVHA